MDEKIARSRAQEKRIANRVGGTRNAGSGNQKRKNDVREPTKLWEMKRTNGKSIIVKLSDLEDVRKNAALDGREAVLHLELGKRRYVIIEEADYFDLRERGDTNG